MVRIIPVMRASRLHSDAAELPILAYRCRRGHLFAFDDRNPCDEAARATYPKSRAISGRRRARRREGFPGSTALNDKIEL